MTQDMSRYYQRREAQERELASLSTVDAIRNIHLELAAAYATQAADLEQQIRPKLRVAL